MDILRSSYISWFYDQRPNITQKKELARLFRHNYATAEKEYAKIFTQNKDGEIKRISDKNNVTDPPKQVHEQKGTRS